MSVGCAARGGRGDGRRRRRQHRRPPPGRRARQRHPRRRGHVPRDRARDRLPATPSRSRRRARPSRSPCGRPSRRVPASASSSRRAACAARRPRARARAAARARSRACARRTRRSSLTLVGVPGIGKSRLVRELFEVVARRPRADRAGARAVRCRTARASAYWALAEIVKAEAGILESDDARRGRRASSSAPSRRSCDEDEAELGRVAICARSSAMAEDERGPRRHARRGVRGLAALLRGARRPRARSCSSSRTCTGPTTACSTSSTTSSTGQPACRCLLVCTARPELLTRRPGWGGGKLNATTVSLVAALAGRDRAPRPRAARPGGAAGRRRRRRCSSAPAGIRSTPRSSPGSPRSTPGRRRRRPAAPRVDPGTDRRPGRRAAGRARRPRSSTPRSSAASSGSVRWPHSAKPIRLPSTRPCTRSSARSSSSVSVVPRSAGENEYVVPPRTRSRRRLRADPACAARRPAPICGGVDRDPGAAGGLCRAARAPLRERACVRPRCRAGRFGAGRAGEAGAPRGRRPCVRAQRLRSCRTVLPCGTRALAGRRPGALRASARARPCAGTVRRRRRRAGRSQGRAGGCRPGRACR